MDGCIVQFVRADGERRTVVVTGPAGFVARRGQIRGRRGVRKTPVPGVESALRAAIEQMASWPGRWKVEVISTPTTILRDLLGSRTRRRVANHLDLPEADLLSKIGRLDLLAGR